MNTCRGCENDVERVFENGLWWHYGVRLRSLCTNSLIEKDDGKLSNTGPGTEDAPPHSTFHDVRSVMIRRRMTDIDGPARPVVDLFIEEGSGVCTKIRLNPPELDQMGVIKLDVTV